MYIEKAQEDFIPEYIIAMDKLTKLGLFSNAGKEIPGQKGLRIKVQEVDPETLEVKYIVGSNSYFGDRQYGLSTVDSVIAMATQPSLFNPDVMNKRSKFGPRSKSGDSVENFYRVL